MTSDGERDGRFTRAWRFGRRVARDLGEDNLTLIAAGVAFYAMLALFPAIIAMVTVYALVADAQQVRDQIEPLMTGVPPAVRDIVIDQLTKAVDASDSGLTVGLVVSLAATLWAASGGMRALMTGLNVITEQTETRGFLALKSIALGLTLGGLITAAVALGFIAVLPVLLDRIGLDPVARTVVQIGRWVLLVVLVDLGLAVVYRYGPTPRPDARWRWITWGTVTALVVWVLASIGFSFYVSSFGGYNKTYGGLAAVIVLLLWLWLSALAILVGAEIDSIRGGLPPRSTGTPVDETAGTDGTQEGNGNMSTVVESVDVNVPVSTAYNQWTQFESFPNFMDGVEEIRQVTDELTHWVVDVAGVRREFDARITEQHPDERVAWASLDGPRHAGVVTFHRLDDAHTRVTVQMDIDPAGIAETVGDKTGLIDRRVKNDVRNFKEFIESRGTATGAWRGDIDRPLP